MKNILVIDDEKEITNLIEIYLKEAGYAVRKRYDASNIMNDIAGMDLVIMDIMMPGINGLEACRRIRTTSNLPIIILSAKNQDMDKITGLNIGADDYMVKPFNPLELVARVNSQLRRLDGFQNDTNEVHLNDFHMVQATHSLTIEGKAIELTHTEFDILYLLASHPGRVYSIEEIFEQVWKEKYFDANNTVMVHIRKIRAKIETDSRNPRYVKTVWSVGYKFEG